MLFSSEQLEEDSFILYAKELDLDMEEFERCLASDEAAGYVDEDIQKGIESGVYGTPTFFIGDQSLVGPQSLRQFRKAIDKELKN